MSSPNGPNEPKDQWARPQEQGWQQPQWSPQPQQQWQPQPEHPQQGQQQQWSSPYGQPAPQYGQPGQQYAQQPGQQWPAEPGQWNQPGQQWGQPEQPWGQPPGEQPIGAPKKKSKLPLIGGAVALVVVAAVVVALVLFFTHKTLLDQNAAQDGVKKVLTESYGVQNLSGVSCPSGVEVKKDAQFTCTVTIDGEHKDVTVTFTDDNGTYEVGRPG
ncbi:DUF4333 domain-containing protein [Skermania sp. ID1734]|uniref:DUF4333 domain-containing protein n=1 Tax=Skermania sp. ID1734 TaxID=2597516 RepID=UPI0011815484|nr:DUF4333 domain-containing protein [Skermania sp. ID1734]TSE01644.1 DUF4333 domain-containing protein [Skermania sp. ID1734]